MFHRRRVIKLALRPAQMQARPYSCSILSRLKSLPHLKSLPRSTGARPGPWRPILFMPGSSELSFSRVRTGPPTVYLSNWPIRDEPLRSLVIAAVEIAVAIAAAYCTGSWAMGMLVAALLLPASWTLWLPVQFELSAKGIVRSVCGWRRRIPWSEFTGYEAHSNGVFLCHHSHHQPLSVVRGLFLPSKSPQTELLAILDYYLRPRDAESNSGS